MKLTPALASANNASSRSCGDPHQCELLLADMRESSHEYGPWPIWSVARNPRGIPLLGGYGAPWARPGYGLGNGLWRLRHNTGCVHVRVLRRLNIRYASILDQAYSLKLELPRKLPPLHDSPPVP